MKVDEIVAKAIELGAMQKEAELSALLVAVKRLKPKTVVEIGTARGGTLYALCQVAAPDALIVSIDLPGGAFGGGYSEKDKQTFLTYAKDKQVMRFMRMDSHQKSTKDKLVSLLENRKIDFLFIDGDHTFGGVTRDWLDYSPLVREGGLVAFHDILLHPKVPECQVYRLWKELERQYETLEFIDKRDLGWGGIGLIIYTETRKPRATALPYGMLLHLGRNVEPPKGFVVMGNGDSDIIHDFEVFPWPLEDNSVHICVGPHVIEHLKPWNVIAFFDELWRVIKPDGQLVLSTPYAGSPAYWSDPTHCCGWNERSFAYFTPEYESYQRYKPKPWKLEKGFPTWNVLSNLEVILRPQK